MKSNKEFLIKEQSIPRFCRNLQITKQIWHTIKHGPGEYKEKRISVEQYDQILKENKWEIVRDDTLLVHEKKE